MTEISLKKLDKTNLQLLKNLNSVIYALQYNDSFYEMLFSSDNHYVYLLIDNTILGTVAFSVNNGNTYIYIFGILPDFRNKGIGSKCLRIVESEIKNNFRCNQVTLNTSIRNLKVVDFYLKNGYFIEATIPNYYIDTECSEAYLMKKIF